MLCKTCSSTHRETIGFAFFWFFCDFIWILQDSTKTKKTIRIYLHLGPRSGLLFTDIPSVCVQAPEKSWDLPMWSSSSAGGGDRRIPASRVPRTVGNRTSWAGSRWNRSGPVHEPVQFPVPNRAYNFYPHRTGRFHWFTGRFFWFVEIGVGAVWGTLPARPRPERVGDGVEDV
jgi:hypothetical protein